MRGITVTAYIASRRFETCLDSLTFSTGPAGKQITRTLSPASWKRYYEHGRRIFNWAIAQGYATVNPFVKFSKRSERNHRETRILPEQGRSLFDAVPKSGGSGNGRRCAAG
jgi:hypothetical protein